MSLQKSRRRKGKTSYKIIEGTESSYVLQSGNSLTIRVDAEFSKFAGIKVDGVQIGKDNYDVKSNVASTNNSSKRFVVPFVVRFT